MRRPEKGAGSCWPSTVRWGDSQARLPQISQRTRAARIPMASSRPPRRSSLWDMEAPFSKKTHRRWVWLRRCDGQVVHLDCSGREPPCSSLARGRGEEEGVAGVVGLGPDPTVVEFGQLRGDGQPQTVALLGPGGVGAIKPLKDPLQLVPGMGCPWLWTLSRARRPSLWRDTRMTEPGGVFTGVVQIDVHHPPQQTGVAVDLDVGRNVLLQGLALFKGQGLKRASGHPPPRR